MWPATRVALMSSAMVVRIRTVLAARLAALPEGDPVLFWRDAATRRCVLDVDWHDTKVILRRVLACYRSRSMLAPLISHDELAQPGGSSHMRTPSGHQLGIVRPRMMLDAFAGDEPVLIGREVGGALRDAVVLADIADARRVLRNWSERGFTDPRGWAAYIGELGESRAGAFLLESLNHPNRASAKTQLEVAVRVAIAAGRRARAA